MLPKTVRHLSFKNGYFEMQIDHVSEVEHQSIRAPTDLIALPHFATSLAMKLPNSLEGMLSAIELEEPHVETSKAKRRAARFIDFGPLHRTRQSHRFGSYTKYAYRTQQPRTA
jgi:hypothetical protein